MLGGIEAGNAWKWSAYGKHPAAKDYFRTGRDVSLAGAFSAWVEKGYGRLVSKGRPIAPPVSWRFWTKESGENRFACGILRDSADAVSRPYPLLVMGSGPAPGWRDHWDLVPAACEAVWTQMEHVSAKSCADLKTLENEIGKVPAPSADWSGLEEKRKSRKGIDPEALHALEEKVRRLSEADPVLCLDGETGKYFELVDACHRILKAGSKEPPNAIFMGGDGLRTCLAVFRRALTESEFLRLWSLSG